MAKIKLNLNALSYLEKVALAERIYQSMSNNGHFTNPIPSLADLQQAKDSASQSYSDVQAAYQLAKLKTAQQEQDFQQLEMILTNLANYVELMSNGDDLIIQSSGMQVKEKSTPIGALLAPQSLSATEGANHGTISLKWKGVRGAKSYLIESSTNINANDWKFAMVSTKSSAIIGNLVSGTQYWFRVSAVGSAGNSPYTDPATKFAP